LTLRPAAEVPTLLVHCFVEAADHVSFVARLAQKPDGACRKNLRAKIFALRAHRLRSGAQRSARR
jgi:hypothetical protein